LIRRSLSSRRYSRVVNVVKKVLQFPARIGDDFTNFLKGFGQPGRDVTLAHRAWFEHPLDPGELQAFYRDNWLARKICDLPAFDTTRAWRHWHAEDDQIQKIEKCERELNLQKRLFDAMRKARLYGGAALIMGIEGQKFENELDVEAVSEGDLKFVHVVSRWMLAAGPRIRDVTSPWFLEPNYYVRSNMAVPPPIGGVQPIEQSSLGHEEGAPLYIHPSRVVRLIGLDYPDEDLAPDPWGDSALQPVHRAIRRADLVDASVAQMISEAKVDVIKVKDLSELMSTDNGTEQLQTRFRNANATKSVVNALLLGLEEEFETRQLQLSGLQDVMNMFMLLVAGGADIPATRLFGREPAGMNATGASDIRNYYDRLAADQKVRLMPLLSRLDEVLIRSALGDRPEEIYYLWAPLWQLDDVEKADLQLKKAQAFKIDVDAGLINPDALRDGRVNQLVEDEVYPGLEAAIEEHGTEPEEDPFDQEHAELDLSMKQQQLENMKQVPPPNKRLPPGLNE